MDVMQTLQLMIDYCREIVNEETPGLGSRVEPPRAEIAAPPAVGSRP
jgi:hypothetical protein